MKKEVCIVTATRAEYGLLRPLISALSNHKQIKLRLVVTGTHLSNDFGLTVNEINDDAFAIDASIPILLDSDSPAAIAKTMGVAMIGFADYFARSKPDLLVLLGDRYETLAIASAAVNFQIPIAHLYGGEITTGAIDDSFRHALTKLSFLHFTSTEEYRKRVIQLGESPARVYTVGAIGVENSTKIDLLNKNDLLIQLKVPTDKPYAVVTYHPVTLDSIKAEEQIHALLSAFQNYPDHSFIVTKANADFEGRQINQIIDDYATLPESNIFAFASLGLRRYLSALKHCEFVIGNSSSAIVEAPSFGVPSINIGSRQQGRTQAESVINCDPDIEAIMSAINIAKSENFREESKRVKNPYQKENSTYNIMRTIEEWLFEKDIILKKDFYDLEVKDIE